MQAFLTLHRGPAAPIRTVLLVALLAMAGAARCQDPPVSDRGQLLYSTHCIACHTEQVHWRDKRQATDWITLKAQVRRWQAAARLQWSEDDIAEVARHLNDTIYHYRQTTDRVGLLSATRH